MNDRSTSCSLLNFDLSATPFDLDNMQFKITCFAVLAAVVATVRGAAVEASHFLMVILSILIMPTQRSDDLEARATQVDGHVFVCTDGGFAGSCTNYGIIANVCSNFPSAFQDNISSIGLDAGWRCNAYS